MPRNGPAGGRRGRFLVGSLACLALAAIGCSSPPASGQPRASGSPSASSSPLPASKAPVTPGILAPLTGVATTAAVAARSTVAVPVAIGAGTPTGLSSADIVYAEWDGASGIRLLALFHSQDNTAVGPVAGLSAADAKLLPVVKPVLAAGPSYAKFTRQAVGADLNVISVAAHPEAFQGTGSSAYASTAALRGLALHGSTAPPNLFPVAAAGEPLALTGVRTASRLKVPTAARPVFSWAWDATQKRWRATVGGAAVSAANVVVLSMPYKTVLAKAPQGPAIATANIFGTGEAYAVSGTKGATGIWARNGPLKLTTVASRDGVAMRFAPGPTWVILVPVGNTWAVE